MSDTVASQPALPGVFARYIGIITAPKATFEKVVQKPRVLAILALSALIMGASQAAFVATERGQQASIDLQLQQAEKFNKMVGRTPSQEEMDATYTRLQKMAPYQKYFVFINFLISLPVGLLIFSGIVWAIFNIAFGGGATYKQAMAVCAHSFSVTSLGFVFGMIIAFARGSMTTSPANLGLLLPMLPEGSFLANFFGMIDIFSVWGTIVTSIGLGVLYHRSARTIATVLLSLYGVVLLIVAFFLSR